MPKIQKCQNEKESPENEESSAKRRRSLRHSPGTSSSVSPPRKSRRMKDSPNASTTEMKNSKPVTTLPKLSKTTSKSQNPFGLINEESNNDSPNPTEATPQRRSMRSSPVPSTLNNVKVKGIKKKPTNKTTSNAFTFRKSSSRTTRSGVGIQSEDSDLQNTKSSPKSNVKTRKKCIVSSPSIQTKTDAQVPSTSHSSGCKRSLSPSPEVSNNGNTNGTTSKVSNKSSKRKRISPSKESPTPCNGKSVNVNSGMSESCAEKDTEQPASKSRCLDSSLLPYQSTSLTSTSTTNNLISETNGKVLKEEMKSLPDLPLTSDKGDSSLKRRLSSSSPEANKFSNKKYKLEENVKTTIDKSREENDEDFVKKNVNSNFLSKSDTETLNPKNKEVDASSNIEVFLKEFGLSKLQCYEVINVLPSELRDCSCVQMIEELVKELLKESTSISSMSSPRFNKLLRQLLMKYCSSDTSVEKKHQLCESALEWSKERKSVNLRHELELALMMLYYNTGAHKKAELTATALYTETKKLQDKEKTVKACLCLSKVYHAMGNISKARANITTAKTEALKIYTPPDLQAELDLQSGIMQVAEEKDMETAFSYFKEAATGFSARQNRSRALKYMLLTKLLVNRPEEGEKAVRSQCHIGDIDDGVEAMLSITKAAISCSLADFKKAREQYEVELEDDLVVNGVLNQLYNKMLEKNLLNIIAPYERMQISVVAIKIGLAKDEVERILSQMILDGQISAQLDHRDHCLYVYHPEAKDTVYQNALENITQFDKTLSLLNRKVKQLL